MATLKYNPILPSIMRAQRAEEDIKVDNRLMELLSSYYMIRLSGDDQFAEKLTWCLEHCQHKFRDLSEVGGRAWYFQNEQDAAMFALKWAS